MNNYEKIRDRIHDLVKTATVVMIAANNANGNHVRKKPQRL